MGAIEHAYRSKLQPDRSLARIAARQRGVVTAAQLATLEWSRGQIQRSLSAGRLHPAYIGVYYVGYVPLDPLARYMAAVLATGGVASHHTSAALYGHWDHHRQPHVTTVRNTRPQANLHRHRTRTLSHHDVTTRFGIPCTTLRRTLIDLADVLDPDPFEALLRRAERSGAIDRLDLHPIRGRRGGAKIRRAHELTRSGAERSFRRALRRAALPMPLFNAPWNGFELDAYWPDHALAVEIDGYRHHRSRDAFRRDRAKGNALAAARITLLRFTYEDVVDHSERAIESVRRFVA